jgi:ferredoxin-NADP reductase
MAKEDKMASLLPKADISAPEELANFDTAITLTREQPDGWTGHIGRVGPELLAEVARPTVRRPLVYVCGPTGFVEGVADELVALGHEPARIRTERFGPT